MLVWMFVVLMLRVYSLTWQFTLLLFFWLSVSDILIWMICLLTWRRVPEFKWSLHQHNQFCEASHRHNLLLRILFDCCNTSLRTALKGIKFYTSLSLSSVTETTVNSSLDRELSYLNVWFFLFFLCCLFLWDHVCFLHVLKKRRSERRWALNRIRPVSVYDGVWKRVSSVMNKWSVKVVPSEPGRMHTDSEWTQTTGGVFTQNESVWVWFQQVAAETRM